MTCSPNSFVFHKLLTLFAVLALTPHAGAAGDVKRGKVLFATCQACHGEKAAGNKALNAPSLVKQNDWYLRRQLENYKSGIRGTHKDDTLGAQMRAMALGLKTAQDVADVVAYIKSLTPSKTAKTVKGNVKNGKDYYNMKCGACHGPKAEGNDILQAPGLAGVDDWYLVHQFENFKNGLRGSHPDDKLGAQMRMMVKALPDKKVVDDVMSYIRSLEE